MELIMTQTVLLMRKMKEQMIQVNILTGTRMEMTENFQAQVICSQFLWMEWIKSARKQKKPLEPKYLNALRFILSIDPVQKLFQMIVLLILIVLHRVSAVAELMMQTICRLLNQTPQNVHSLLLMPSIIAMKIMCFQLSVPLMVLKRSVLMKFSLMMKQPQLTLLTPWRRL